MLVNGYRSHILKAVSEMFITRLIKPSTAEKYISGREFAPQIENFHG